MSKTYEIDISPEILELLGPSLYTNIYYVLAELIANAYDADAHNVYIIEGEHSIAVEDDGTGMSYECGVKKYLNVAHPTRVDPADDKTPLGRKKMGRKGVGKLAALSVSKEVKILTRSTCDRSGFILSRTVSENRLLKPIPENQIVFEFDHPTGTSVIMDNPEYNLHKTLEAQKRNLLRMFPIVSTDFRIHLVTDDKTVILDKFDEAVIPQLSTLITIGDQYQSLSKHFDLTYEDISDKVLIHLEPENLSEVIDIADKDNQRTTCEVSIEGWIGTYKTTTQRKKNSDDFPDNYLSLFANGKLGAFNIIPEIGMNRLSESYVVGQLHVDVFERTDLPDMAMSNRQGYKTEDVRYQTAIKIIRNDLFTKVLNMRDSYTDRKKLDRDQKKQEELKKKEDELRKNAAKFAKSVSSKISKNIESTEQLNNIDDIATESVNNSLNLLGLKSQVDANKKKVLISHAGCDKDLADLIYRLLILNDVEPEDIIYTSSENEKSRIPDGYAIYDYLREFFVESASSQLISVIFITSKASATRWGPVCEVGAAWVTRSDHKIFNIEGYRPEKPLDDESEWHTSRIEDDGIHMTARNADVLKVKIRNICRSLGVEPKEDPLLEKLIQENVIIDV